MKCPHDRAMVATPRTAVTGFSAATPSSTTAEATRSAPGGRAASADPTGASAGRRNIEQNVGTMTSATKSELDSVMMSVRGR